MTSTKSYVLIDTNILIYATDAASVYHQSSIAFMKGNYKRLVLCNQNVNEYLRVVTHPKFLQPLKTQEALNNIENIKKSFCSFILPTDSTHKLFTDLVKKYKVKSNQIFDVYLVAIALSNNITSIATYNDKDFDTFREIAVCTL